MDAKVGERAEFELSEAQLQKILDASKPVPYMIVGGQPPHSPQQNANRAWAALGRELGFEPMSVKPVPGKDQRFFTAIVCEPDTEAQAVEEDDLLTRLGTDGERWAREFIVRVIDEKIAAVGADDEELLDMVRGWFANAIEAGRTAGQAVDPGARHVSAGPVEVDLALPEMPDDVAADVHLVVKPKTEEEARAVLESFGGLAAFEEIRDTAWPVATIHGDGMSIGVQLPTTRPVRAPFAVELAEEQRKRQVLDKAAADLSGASNEVEESELPGPPNPPATDERPVG